MHHFLNFKGFEDAQIDLIRPMTLLIGRNGSGKTNVIEGVELLAQIASGRPLYEISDIGSSSNNFQIRGGLQGCVRNEVDGLNIFNFGFVCGINPNLYFYPEIINLFDEQYKNEELVVFYQITIFFVNEEPFVLNENLAIQGADVSKDISKDIFHAQNRLNALEISFNDFTKNNNEFFYQQPATHSVLSCYKSIILDKFYGLTKFEKNNIPIALGLSTFIKEHLGSAFIFDLHPHLMRQYQRIGISLLNKDGSNISAVLYSIKLNDKNKELKQQLLPRLLKQLQQLPEEPFIDFEFITTTANDVLLALKREDGAIIDARLLSDGTLRTLAILTALETVPEKSRIVIEELDNGVHPSRVKLLVDTIWECSHRRNLNVLVTTHNPATLNGLTPEQLDCVVVCHYDSIEKADKLTALPDIPDSDILLQKGSLGDLVTRNVLESYLMPNFVEEQKQKAQEWLDLF
jgi:AAA15 family ATPase/GTPase